MAWSYDVERILATIEWAHATLLEHGREGASAMDRVLAKCQSSKSGRKPEKWSRFARYLRGDNVPRGDTVCDLIRDDLRVNYATLPVFNVLRVGMDGYGTDGGNHQVEVALDDLQGRFQRRITRYEGPGLVVVSAPPTRKGGFELAAYASSHAVAVLLAWAMELQTERQHFDAAPNEYSSPPYNALHMGQRAFQCLMLAFAQGEFPVTAPLMAARVRQKVLDRLCVDGQVLDTAAVDVDAAVKAARDALDLARAGRANAFQQRAFLRAWLKSNDPAVAQLTPQVAAPEQAHAARQARPVALHLRAADAKGRARALGKRAHTTFSKGMAEYVTSVGSAWKAGAPQDESGAHGRSDLDVTGQAPAARM